MNASQLHEEMTIGTMKAAGMFKQARAIEKAVAERRKALSLATNPLDDALASAPAALTPHQSELLLNERGTLVKAARKAFGAMPPESAKTKIRRWAAGLLESFALAVRIKIDVASEVEQVLSALYGQPAEPATTDATKPASPPVPTASGPVVGPVSASNNPPLRTFRIELTDLEGHPLMTPVALKL